MAFRSSGAAAAAASSSSSAGVLGGIFLTATATAVGAKEKVQWLLCRLLCFLTHGGFDAFIVQEAKRSLREGARPVEEIHGVRVQQA